MVVVDEASLKSPAAGGVPTISAVFVERKSWRDELVRGCARTFGWFECRTVRAKRGAGDSSAPRTPGAGVTGRVVGSGSGQRKALRRAERCGVGRGGAASTAWRASASAISPVRRRPIGVRASHSRYPGSWLARLPTVQPA